MQHHNIYNNEEQLTFDLSEADISTLTQQGSILLEDKERHPSRYHTVVKSNDLIKRTRYFLPALQQRLLLLFISKIKPDDSELLTYKITIREIAETLGLSTSGGSVYKRIRGALKALRDSSWFIKDEDGETLFSWLDTYTYSKGIITVKLSESLRPYLLAQSRDFTQYQLIGALALKSKYAIRLYEMLLCDAWRGKPITYKIDTLREDFAEPGKLMAYKNFKKVVITNSIEEIDKVTDIYVDFVETRTAEGVKYITFEVKYKRQLERLAADINALKTLTASEYEFEKEEDILRNIRQKLSEDQKALLSVIASHVKEESNTIEGNDSCVKAVCTVDGLLQAVGNYTTLLNALEELCVRGWTVAEKRRKRVYKFLYSYEIKGAEIEVLADSKMLSW